MNRYVTTAALTVAMALVYASPVVAFTESPVPKVIHALGAVPLRELPDSPFYRSPSLTTNLHAVVKDNRARQVAVVVDSATRIRQLEAYSQAVSTPGNPLYHHFLTPYEVDTQFGPTTAMVSQTKAALKAAGWHVGAVHGLVLDAVIPAHLSSPGLPVAPAIWSVSGIAPVKAVARGTGLWSRPETSSGSKPLAGLPNQASVLSAGLMSTYHLEESPVYAVGQSGTNGDTVFAMSWNPGFLSSLAAGLPVTLTLAAESANGSPIPITNVTNVQDSTNNIGAFALSANNYGARFPASHHELWQLPLTALAAASAGDSLDITVTLGDGTSQLLAVRMPQFTGQATTLGPLSGPQLNTIVGANQIAKTPVASRPPVAVYVQGQIPSMTDLSSLMAQESLPVPPVHFQYFDGATSTMTDTTTSPESNLDVQALASVDPGAPIVEYVYPANTFTDPFVSMLTALSQQSTVKIASVSYGFYGESASTVSTLVAACNAEGITIIDGSGDNGAWETASGDPGPVGVESNDGQPGITTAGGLDLASPATYSNGGNVEGVSFPAIAKAWGGDYLNGLPLAVAQAYTAPNAASTGGYGFSPIPSWQQGFLPASAPGIGVPDISALAGEPGLLGEFGGQSVYLGGTSLAAPLTAAWLAETEAFIGQGSSGLGNINPILFQAAQSHPNDYIQAKWGANGVYSVTSPTPGTWNPVTGLGQPIWDRLALLWDTAAPAAFSVSAGASTVQVGDSIPYTITALNAQGNPAAYTGSVTLTSSDPTATFPATVSLTQGTGSFSVAYHTVGSQQMTVTGPSSATPGVSSPITVTSGLTVSAPGSMTVGQPLTLSAQGSGLTAPLYQFWIQNPATQQWSASGAYQRSNQDTVTETVPGTYRVEVFVKSATSGSTPMAAQGTFSYLARAGSPMVSLLAVTAPQVTETVGSGATVTAAATDAGGTPEYQFWVHGPNNVWRMVQNYSVKNTFSLTNMGAGSYVVSVYALDQKEVRAGLWQDAFYNDTFINVGSQVSLQLPTLATVLNHMTIRATSVGLTHPVYQFWVQSPDGHWKASGPYGSSDFVYTPNHTGTYRVVVYAKDPLAPATAHYAVMARQSFSVN